MEKKFEELIEETPLDELLSIPENDLVKELLQQVREATKEEILKLTDDNLFKKEPKWRLIANIEKLPTDRIKTEK